MISQVFLFSADPIQMAISLSLAPNLHLRSEKFTLQASIGEKVCEDVMLLSRIGSE